MTYSELELWLDKVLKGNKQNFRRIFKAVAAQINENVIITETLSGVINNVNTIFSTSMPYQSGTISVFVNGLKEKYFDEISETQIQLHSAPSNVGFNDKIEAIFTKKPN